MATYPYTGSIFDSIDGASGGKTRTGLSTQIVVYVNNQPVGAIQQMSVRQSRPIKKIPELGTDGFIDSAPSSQTTVGLTINRIYFDALSITEALARSFRNIHAQRIPFDVRVIDRFTGTEDDGAIVTTYHNCWFESLNKSYNASDYIITEDVSLSVEAVSEERNGGPVASSQGINGGRDLGAEGRQIDSIEQAADYGTYRGSMDFPGLLKAQF